MMTTYKSPTGGTITTLATTTLATDKICKGQLETGKNAGEPCVWKWCLGIKFCQWCKVQLVQHSWGSEGGVVHVCDTWGRVDEGVRTCDSCGGSGLEPHQAQAEAEVEVEAEAKAVFEAPAEAQAPAQQ